MGWCEVSEDATFCTAKCQVRVSQLVPAWWSAIPERANYTHVVLKAILYILDCKN